MTSFRIRWSFAVPGLSSVLLAAALAGQSADRADAVRRQLQRQVQGKPLPAMPAELAGDRKQQRRRQDPIQKLISDLETGDHERHTTSAGKAYRELKKLGVLVLPAIHRRLLDLGPFGIRAALALAVEYPTPELYKNLALMLEDRDLGKQILAARVLFRLPNDKVRKLVALASKSPHPVVRLGGLHAQAVQAVTGADVNAILAEIKPLLLRREKDVRRGAAIVLESMKGPEVKRILEDLLRNGELWAAEDWVRRTDAKDEAAALALYERLQDTGTRAVLVRHVVQHRRSWLRLQARGLEVLRTPIPNRPGDVVSITSILEVLRDSQVSPGKEQFRRLLGTHDPGTLYWVADKAAQLVLQRPKAKEWAAVVEQAMLNVNVKEQHREQAFAWLVEVDPARLLARTEEFLRRDGRFASLIQPVLAEQGDASQVPAVTRYLRGSLGKSRGISKAMSHFLSAKSDKDSLPAFLKLFSLPLERHDGWADAALAASGGMRRWFARDQIAACLEASPGLDGFFAFHLLNDIHRVATRQDGAVVATALRASIGRLRNWSKQNARLGQPLSSTSTIKRLVAVLGKIGGDGAGAALRPLLTHKFVDLRQLVFRTLLRMEGVDKKELVLAVLANDGPLDLLERALDQRLSWADADVRSQVERRLLAATADRDLDVEDYQDYLSCLPVPVREDLALKILKEQQSRASAAESIVQAALAVLGASKEAPRLVPQFAAWIKYPNYEIRNQAIRQLGRTYTADAVPHLLEALKDEESRIRSHAQGVLTRFEEYQKNVERFSKLREMKTLKKKDKDK